MNKSLTLLLVVLLVGCGSSSKKKSATPAKPPPPKKTVPKKQGIDQKVTQAFWKELPNIPITEMKSMGADAWPALLLMDRKDMTDYSLLKRIQLARLFWLRRGMETVTKAGATTKQKATGASIVVAASLLSEYVVDLKDPKTLTDTDRSFEAAADKARKDLRKYVPRHIFIESWNALKAFAKQQGWPLPGELTL